jgi:RimJ/RimL family protein N-acetyltransferase
MIINTPRTRLRCWHETDREAFAAMHAHPEVMLDYGGPLDRVESDAKFDRYVAAFARAGFCRWAIEGLDGGFLGYAGIMLSGGPDHPLGAHAQIGWRLVRCAWGHGYATEAAQAALQDALTRVGLIEVLSYTAPDNLSAMPLATSRSRIGVSGCGKAWSGWLGRYEVSLTTAAHVPNNGAHTATGTQPPELPRPSPLRDRVQEVTYPSAARRP